MIYFQPVHRRTVLGSRYNHETLRFTQVRLLVLLYVKLLPCDGNYTRGFDPLEDSV